MIFLAAGTAVQASVYRRQIIITAIITANKESQTGDVFKKNNNKKQLHKQCQCQQQSHTPSFHHSIKAVFDISFVKAIINTDDV